MPGIAHVWHIGQLELDADAWASDMAGLRVENLGSKR